MNATTNAANDLFDFDLKITKITPRDMADGTWVCGTADDIFRFEALVFAEHAESEEYELGKSKISKLWIQRLSDKKTVFNFDRGNDVRAGDTYTLALIAFLGEGLADLVYGR